MNTTLIIKSLDNFIKAAQPAWKKYHEIADKAKPKVRRKFLKAIAALQDTVIIAAVNRALEQGDIAGAENAIDWQVFDEKFAEVEAVIESVALECIKPYGKELAEATAKEALFYTLDIGLPEELPQIGAYIAFDLKNPEAIAWARARAAELIVEVSDETKAGVRAIITDALEIGKHPYKTAKQVKQFVGLTERQAKAVLNFRSRLEAKGVYSVSDIDRKVERYRKKLLKYRSEVIAREETIRASKEGNLKVMESAINEGFVDPGIMVRRWLTVPDDRRCILCLEMDGETVPLLEPYSIGTMVPHRHIMCRCSESIETKSMR